MTLLGDPRPLRLRTGIEWGMEDEADRLLNDDRRQRTAAGNPRSDWLSRDQLLMRQNREIGNELGVCDPSLRQGMFRRVYNPCLGQRPNGHGRSED